MDWPPRPRAPALAHIIVVGLPGTRVDGNWAAMSEHMVFSIQNYEPALGKPSALQPGRSLTARTNEDYYYWRSVWPTPCERTIRFCEEARQNELPMMNGVS